jgi:hypothetical protein
MPDYTRNFQFKMPVGSDSMASSQALTDLNAWVDEVDSRLAAVAAMGTDPALFLGVWETNGTDQVFSSTSTIANVTLPVVNKITVAGTGTPTVGTTSGDIQFPTAGFYRVTLAPTIYYVTTITEGQLSFGLKPTGVASYVTRCSFQMAMETRGGATMASKSFIVRAASSGGDVDLTTVYKVGFQQTNSSAASVNYGDSDPTASWFAIEYLRPVT